MLLSEEAAASSADGKAAKMSELNTDKAYAKPEVEQEKLKGTGLLSEEHKTGRESLAKKMAPSRQGARPASQRSTHFSSCQAARNPKSG